MRDFQTLSPNAISLSALPGTRIVVAAEQGAAYVIDPEARAARPVDTDMVMLRLGDDLVLRYADGTEIVIDGFYAAGATLEFTDADGVVRMIDATAVTAQGDGVVYMSGDTASLMDLLPDDMSGQANDANFVLSTQGGAGGGGAALAIGGLLIAGLVVTAISVGDEVGDAIAGALGLNIEGVDDDDDGTYDRITFRDVESRFDLGTVADRADFSTLDVDNTSAQTITLTAADLTALAGGDTDYELEIGGDSNDVVRLDGLTATGTTDARGTEYAGPVGSVFIDDDITVQMI